MFKIILSALAGYLLGSINLAIIISKYLKKQDVRERGSKNAGATNVARVFGMKMGVLTLAGDFLKTLAAMFVGKLLCGNQGIAAAVAACLIGHCWPLYFGFKGGKGVATGACVILIVDWRVFLIIIAVFAAVFAATRIVSASSLAAASAAPIAVLFFKDIELPFVILTFFAAALVWFHHRSNIKRIINGTEQKFKPGKGNKI